VKPPQQETDMTLVNENGLAALVTMLREGRDYYAFAAEEVRDAETADAFRFAAKCKSEMLDGLVAAHVIQRRSLEHVVGPAAADEGYERLRKQMDPMHPELQGPALYERERRVVKLIESVFRTENALPIRRALKNGYPQAGQLARMTQRLAQRRAAA
jgi:hypothetical protein